ncbi:MAG: LacI family transcriptional regulator [Chloroflexi bacterium]|nr:LacI family transcriptional regulator [Chloroflexota bacterium]
MARTLEEIGKLAGVSRSTVSRVINGSESVREQVRERVWQVVRETGYQPHAAARSLVTRRTQVVGVIIPEALTTLFTDPFFPLFLRGVTETCNARHYLLMLSLFHGQADQRDLYRRVVRGGHLDGVIVASSRLDDPLVPHLLQDRVPLVLVGRHPDERVSYVDVDNVSAGRMAVEHLVRLGHQRIGIITGPLSMAHGQDRLAGYRQALEAHGLPVEEKWIVEGDYTEGSGAMAVHRWLPTLPTAIFGASDLMAIGALKALRQADLRVPQDVALVGFDDVPLAAAIEPALTTVRQPIGRLGSLAADLLLNWLDNSSSAQASVHRIVLPAELVVRDSCGALA